MQKDISEREKIDGYVDQLGCRKLSRITASFVSKNTNTCIDAVKRRLLKLKQESKLYINYELECPNPQCAKTIQVYRSGDEIPFGELKECMDCGKVFNVGLENIWVTFDPNKDYFSEKRCRDILGENENTFRDIKGSKVVKVDDDTGKAYVKGGHLKYKNGRLSESFLQLSRGYYLIVYSTTSCIIALYTMLGIVRGSIPVDSGVTIIVGFLGGNLVLKKILEG